MAVRGSTVIEVVVRVIDQASKKLAELVGLTRSFEDRIKSVNKSAQEQESTFDSITNVGRKFAISIGAATAAYLAFSRALQSTIKSQEAQVRLNAILRTTGEESRITADQISRIAQSLERTTGISKTATTSFTALLLQFRAIDSSNIERVSEAVADLSARFGTDLESTAISVGKALNDPIRGFENLRKTLGIQLTQAQRESIKNFVETGQQARAVDVILNALERTAGGVAGELRNTLGGSLRALSSEISNTTKLSDAQANALSGPINRLVETFQQPEVKEGFAGLKSALAAIGTIGASTFSILAQGIIDAVAALGLLSKALLNPLKAIREIRAGTFTTGVLPPQIGDAGGPGRAGASSRGGITTRAARPPDISEETRTEIEAALKASLTPLEQQRQQINQNIAALNSFVNIYSRFTDQQLASVGVTRTQLSDASEAINDLKNQLSSLAIQEQILRDLPEIVVTATKTSTDAMTELLDSWNEATETSIEKAVRSFNVFSAQVDGLVAAGRINAEQAAARTVEFLEQLLPEIEVTAKKIGPIINKSWDTIAAEEAAKRIQASFAAFLFDPFQDGLKGMLKGFVDTLRKMLAEAAASAVLRAVASFFPGGSFLNTLFTPRAMGGPVSGGGSYLVGERGPEIFTPGASGMITPNHRIGGGGNVTVAPVYNIDARGATQEFIKILPSILEENTRRAVQLARATIYDDFNRGAFGRL